MPRNHGFDGVFVKHGSDGKVSDIIISEAKATKTGKVRYGNSKNADPKIKEPIKQMSDDWIRKNIKKMIKEGSPEVKNTGKFLDKNIDLIRKKVSAFDAKGVNRWNNEIPN